MWFSVVRVAIFAGVLSLAALSLAAQSGSMSGTMFAGETLTYEGKISKYKVGISVADLTFTATQQPGSKELLIKTDAVSKGTLLKLFKYSFLQQYESTVDLDSFRIAKTTKHDVQKERVRDSEAIFDYTEKRVRYVETDPKDKNRPPRRIASEISEPLYDMVSAIFYARMAPLATGKRFDLAVSDSGLVFQVPIVVTGRETMSTAIGKVSCFKLEPEIFGKDRLIEQNGKMIVWITDDARRIPVRAQINTSFGKVEVKLKGYSKKILGTSDSAM